MNQPQRNIVACLMLAVAVAACQTAPHGAGIDLGDAGATMTSRDLAFVGDALATGRDVHWQGQELAYTLDVLRTYEDHGTTCREYRLQGNVQAERRIEVRGHACRARDGRWRS